MTDYRNILVFLPNWVGDVVMATPMLRTLRRRFAEARITYVGKPVAVETIRGTPWADELLVERSRAGLMATANMMITLRRARYDLAVLLPNSFRSAMLARLGGADDVIGYARDGRSVFLTTKLSPPRGPDGRFTPTPMIDYYNALATRLGCDDPGGSMQLHTPATDETAADALLRGAGVPPALCAPRDKPQKDDESPSTHNAGGTPAPRLGPLVMLNPGASFGPSKLWPAERFAAVADGLVAARGARIIINAAPSEHAVAQAVADAMTHPPLVNFVGKQNSLGLLKALLGRCELLVTNDTGARHIAAARGCGLVTVFGSTDPTWARIDYPRERIVRRPVPCGPCQQKTCSQPAGPDFHRCMTSIAPETVLAECLAVLDLPRDAGAPPALCVPLALSVEDVKPSSPDAGRTPARRAGETPARHETPARRGQP